MPQYIVERYKTDDFTATVDNWGCVELTELATGKTVFMQGDDADEMSLELARAESATTKQYNALAVLISAYF